MITTFKNYILLFLLLFFLLWAAYFLGRNFSKSSSRTYVDTSRDSVVQQIESLNRLETASFTIEKVIEAGTQGNQFQEILYGDRILLIAHGKVVAGIDLSQFNQDDVSITGSTISATFPAPTIFSTSLDSSKTKVFDRKLGLLSRGDQNLESQARAGAETAITEAACTAGILNEAASSGKIRLTDFFKSLGFENITITIPTGNCK